MVTFAAVAVAVALTLVGELLHARRVARVAALVFGPGGRPAPVAFVAPLLRPLAIGLLAWGFATLAQLPPKIHRGEEVPPEEWRHLVLGRIGQRLGMDLDVPDDGTAEVTS